MRRFSQFFSALAASLLVSSIALAASPVADTAAADTSTATNYTLRAGDNLHVSVWKEDELDRHVLILPDGTIDFPLIGSVTASGLTPTQLKESITQKLQPFIPAAVSVVVKDTSGNTVSVIGQVARPGDIIMNHALNVMQALSQAGGPTPYADEDSIVILRKGPDNKQVSLHFDYTAVTRGRHLDENINLQPGDVIVVPTASLF